MDLIKKKKQKTQKHTQKKKVCFDDYVRVHENFATESVWTETHAKSAMDYRIEMVASTP